MGAVQLGHHGAHFSAIEHAHQNRLNYIVKMMPKCNFIAAQLLRPAVKAAAPHAGAQVARRGGGAVPVHYLKEPGVKHLYGQAQQCGVIQQQAAVFRAVAGVHHQIFHLKGNFRIKLEMLHTLGQQHGILTAGDTDRDAVARRNQAVILDTADKTVPNRLLILFNDAAFHLLALFHIQAPPIPRPRARTGSACKGFRFHHYTTKRKRRQPLSNL